MNSAQGAGESMSSRYGTVRTKAFPRFDALGAWQRDGTGGFVLSVKFYHLTVFC